LSGDIIAGIDGESVQGLRLNQAIDKMRGAPHTTVALKILRGANKEPQDIKLNRASWGFHYLALLGGKHLFGHHR
jgi:carboxyl-terminal processing protease